MESRNLTIKYSLIQTLFFATFCIIIGYATNYLTAIGMTTTIVGIILAAANLIATVLQPALAGFVDKRHVPINKLLIVLLLGMAILSGGLLLFSGVKLVAGILYVIVAALLSSFMPLINAMAFTFEKHDIHISYGVARGIGSASYAIVSLVMGYVLKAIDPKILPLFYIVVFVGLMPLLNSFRVKGIKNVPEHEEKEENNTNFFVKYKKFMIFLGGFILVYFAHMIINNFMIKVIGGVTNNSNNSSALMGQAVFLAAMVELPAMSIFEKLKDRINITFILKISAIAFTVKHILTYLAVTMHSMPVMYIAQALQCLAYAFFIPASVYYIDKLVEKKDAVKGQSLATMSMTIAGIFASLLGGVFIDYLSMPTTLLVGAIASVIGTVVMLIFIEDVRNA